MAFYPADAERAAYPVVLYWEPDESSSSSEAESDSEEDYVDDICLERGTVRTWRTGAWMRHGDGKRCGGCEGLGKKKNKKKGDKKKEEKEKGEGGLLKRLGVGGEGRKKGQGEKNEKETECECFNSCCTMNRCQQDIGRASGPDWYGKSPGPELYSYGGYREEHHGHHSEDRGQQRSENGGKRKRKVRFADEVDSSEDYGKGRVVYWEDDDRSGRRRGFYDMRDGIEVVPARGHVTRWETPMASGAKGGYLGDTRWIEGMIDYSQDEQMGI